MSVETHVQMEVSSTLCANDDVGNSGYEERHSPTMIGDQSSTRLGNDDTLVSVDSETPISQAKIPEEKNTSDSFTTILLDDEPEECGNLEKTPDSTCWSNETPRTKTASSSSLTSNIEGMLENRRFRNSKFNCSTATLDVIINTEENGNIVGNDSLDKSLTVLNNESGTKKQLESSTMDVSRVWLYVDMVTGEPKASLRLCQCSRLWTFILLSVIFLSIMSIVSAILISDIGARRHIVTDTTDIFMISEPVVPTTLI